MSAKKVPVSNSGQMALRIGSRVRCTDDGVQGRITWANGVSVKVRWDDGEQVTWRRDSLADRPIEILDPADDDGQATLCPEPDPVGEDGSTETPAEETTLTPPALEETTTEPMQPAATVAEPATVESVAPVSEAAEARTTPATLDKEAETLVPAKRRRKAPAAPKEKKLSALDAAVKVLGEAGQPMNCQELITAMAEKGYWKSPGGKTPAATLYSAILREITTKGTSSRFVKAERGKFARTGSL